MKLKFKQETIIVESRFLWAGTTVLVLICALLVRLWYIQIYKGDYYRTVSERNRVRRIELSVPRGVIYDRFGQVILGNRPFFDLVYIPQYVKDRTSTLKVLARVLHVPFEQLEHRLRVVRGRPKFLPIVLKQNLSLHEVSTIESVKIFLPGIDIKVAPRRDYQPDTPPHLVGYLREVDSKTIKDYNKTDSDNPYYPGDLIGKQGLEKQWESFLRGKRGYQLVQVDAFGRRTSDFSDHKWLLPKVAARPGADLELTIDKQLQGAVQKAFNGKYGAVVVLDPRNGEILAEVSEPGFDPKIMQTGLTKEEWRFLTSNPFKPFLDKTTGGEFSPGSIYKPVVAMAALEEKIITPKTKFKCQGSFVLGNQVYACHDRAGHGIVDLKKALMRSCDVFFYHVGVELGVDKLARYAEGFGLGEKLGIKLNAERSGLIPTSSWKLSAKGVPWTAGDTPPIAIGQGYNLMTPMQMANLYAAIANGGKIWRPFLVKRVTNHVGEVVMEQKPALIRENKMISQKTYKQIRDMLEAVVSDPKGTGRRSQVKGATVAGKTGSVQVVSLKKNHNQTDVSMKWKEHAIFAAFSPAEKAEIAVLVFSENDKVGGGGRSAAPVAKKVIEKYWELKRERAEKAIARK